MVVCRFARFPQRFLASLCFLLFRPRPIKDVKHGEVLFSSFISFLFFHIPIINACKSFLGLTRKDQLRSCEKKKNKERKERKEAENAVGSFKKNVSPNKYFRGHSHENFFRKEKTFFFTRCAGNEAMYFVASLVPIPMG